MNAGPGQGPRYRTVNCGLNLHRIPDQVVDVGLAGQLERHVGAHWYAVVMYADGRGFAFGATNQTPEPPAEAIDWMAKASVALNRDLHQDGHWVVAWDGSKREPVLVWRDADGDIHAAMEMAPDPRDPRGLASIDRATLLDQAADMLNTLREQTMKAAVTRAQQVKLAQGGEALARRLHALPGRH